MQKDIFHAILLQNETRFWAVFDRISAENVDFRLNKRTASAMTRQKQGAVIGVSIGVIPVSQGTMMPTQPSSSRIPSMRRGAT